MQSKQQYALWVHLHGLSFAGWWAGPELNHPIRGAEAFAYVKQASKASVPGADDAIQVRFVHLRLLVLLCHVWSVSANYLLAVEDN